MKAIDLTGLKLGRLEILAPADSNERGETYWLCQCSCGNKKIAQTKRLLNGSCQSCGCLARELSSARALKHGYAKFGQHSREYRTYWRMITRCYNPNYEHYYLYGGRGIQVCDSWLDSEHGFENFLADMGPTPGLGYSIERVDNDANYGPDNPCRWATPKEQANNRRNNRVIEWEGESKTLSQWAELLGISGVALAKRLKKWTKERAFTELPHKEKMVR